MDTSNRSQLSKALVDKNNCVLVNEINSFRLLYKINEKLKKSANPETELISHLSNDILQRVTNLKRCCIDLTNVGKYDLKDVDNYLSEQRNPTIKKYKAVISEYYKKYTNELSPKSSRIKSASLSEYFTIYMKKNKTSEDKN